MTTLKTTMIRHLRHIGIVVSDLETARQIFESFLGCTLEKTYTSLSGDYYDTLTGINNAKLNIIIFKTSNGELFELIEYPENQSDDLVSAKPDTPGISHFSVTVEDLDMLFAKRHDFDVEFISDPLVHSENSVKVAYVRIMNEFIAELVEELEESK